MDLHFYETECIRSAQVCKIADSGYRTDDAVETVDCTAESQFPVVGPCLPVRSEDVPDVESGDPVPERGLCVRFCYAYRERSVSFLPENYQPLCIAIRATIRQSGMKRHKTHRKGGTFLWVLESSPRIWVLCDRVRRWVEFFYGFSSTTS